MIHKSMIYLTETNVTHVLILNPVKYEASFDRHWLQEQKIAISYYFQTSFCQDLMNPLQVSNTSLSSI